MANKKDDQIQFKPLSEGLGINHFADGLPYSPVSQGKRTMMQFQVPTPRAPRYGQQESKPAQAATPPAQPAPKQNFSPLTTPVEKSEVGLFTSVAYAVFYILLASLCAATVAVTGLWLNGISLNSLLLQAPLSLLSLFGVVAIGFLAILKISTR